MRYQIRVRRLAELDLEEAEDWYDVQRPGLGVEFRDAIDELFARLTGLRLLEALRLRVKDVDFAANLLVVREGKGSKNRRTKLPDGLRDPLHAQIEEPAKLNDTFEFSLPVSIQLSPTELIEHVEKRFKLDYVAPTLLDAMMEHGGSSGFSATDRFVQDFLSSANADNRVLFAISLIHFLRDQGLSTQDIVHKLALGANTELLEHLERDLRKAYSKNHEIGQHCGVLSLSGRYDDPLMWAHYGDSCKGMCIGIAFDVDELVQSEFLPFWVEYSEELPLLGASVFFDRQPANVIEMLKIFYATKYVA